MDRLDEWQPIEPRFGVRLPHEEFEIETFHTVPRLAARIAPTAPEVA